MEHLKQASKNVGNWTEWKKDLAGVSEAHRTPRYAISFDLKHTNTMVVATNNAELAYIEKWCEINDILPSWMGDRDKFPIALSPNGGGWTDSMDRALYYVRFRDFINLVA